MLLHYFILGPAVGLLTGLLGGGSGIFLIPILANLLTYQSVPPELIMRMSVGTSLSIALVAVLASLPTHYKRAPEAKNMALLLFPGSLMGAFAGLLLASYLNVSLFKYSFSLIILTLGIYTVYERPQCIEKATPNKKTLIFLSIPAGLIATCFGVGMGPLCIPMLKRYGIAMSKAVAVSAFIGVFLVIFAVGGFILTGYQQPNLPAYSFGYVSLPLFFAIGIPSILFAQIGTKLAHKCSQSFLKKIFVVFLFAIGLKMLLF